MGGDTAIDIAHYDSDGGLAEEHIFCAKCRMYEVGNLLSFPCGPVSLLTSGPCAPFHQHKECPLALLRLSVCRTQSRGWVGSRGSESSSRGVRRVELLRDAGRMPAADGRGRP